MAIKVGDRLPEATFRVAGPDGLETLTTKDVFAGKRVVLFAVPGSSPRPAISSISQASSTARTTSNSRASTGWYASP